MPPLVPPIKCQGIKTKLVSQIKPLVPRPLDGRWIEPFCGSCVVAFNVLPEQALLSDTNPHLIRFYQAVQSGVITPAAAKEFLCAEGEKLQTVGDAHYYEVRERFNQTYAPLDFLFLNRACFNGVIRFNQKGGFNVPFCHKTERFSKAYITKITNQIQRVSNVLQNRNWIFSVADFADSLSNAAPDDFVYADPPYQGRTADYYNTWNAQSEQNLAHLLKSLPCSFLLSTWQENEFRKNPSVSEHWQREPFRVVSLEHFYHVGATKRLRHPMTEALITNYCAAPNQITVPPQQLPLFA